MAKITKPPRKVPKGIEKINAETKTRLRAKPSDTTSSRAEQTKCDESIAVRDPTLLSDMFAQAIKRYYGDITTLEQGDIHIASRSIMDTTSFGQRRVAKNIPQYMTTFSNTDEDVSADIEPGSPHTVVIASSGLRVADLVRELRPLSLPEITVAKYFAKHMKLQANIDFAKRTKVGIAVGTPTRLKDLVENDAIKADKVRRIVIDASYQNDKSYTIFDMADAFKPMLELLNMTAFKVRLTESEDRLQIMIF